MPPVGFKPAIPAGDRLQTYALDRSATCEWNLQKKIITTHGINLNT
jgi:hypothetical protein